MHEVVIRSHTNSGIIGSLSRRLAKFSSSSGDTIFVCSISFAPIVTRRTLASNQFHKRCTLKTGAQGVSQTSARRPRLLPGSLSKGSQHYDLPEKLLCSDWFMIAGRSRITMHCFTTDPCLPKYSRILTCVYILSRMEYLNSNIVFRYVPANGRAPAVSSQMTYASSGLRAGQCGDLSVPVQ